MYLVPFGVLFSNHTAFSYNFYSLSRLFYYPKITSARTNLDSLTANRKLLTGECALCELVSAIEGREKKQPSATTSGVEGFVVQP